MKSPIGTGLVSPVPPYLSKVSVNFLNTRSINDKFAYKTLKTSHHLIVLNSMAWNQFFQYSFSLVFEINFTDIKLQLNE